MKAMMLHQIGLIEERPPVLEGAAEPRPGPDELLVHVHVCGVYGTDLHQVEGEVPMKRAPVIPGHQIVGSVAAAGAEVKGFRAGDRIGVAWLHRACGTCRFGGIIGRSSATRLISPAGPSTAATPSARSSPKPSSWTTAHLRISPRTI